MKSLTKSLKDIGFLTIALTLALAANFAYGEWNNPPNNPPSNNGAVPINTGTDEQTKSGKLNVFEIDTNRIRVNTSVRAEKYCDPTGLICIDMEQSPVTLPGQVSPVALPTAPAPAGCTNPEAEHMEIITRDNDDLTYIDYTSGSQGFGDQITTTETLQCKNGNY